MQRMHQPSSAAAIREHSQTGSEEYEQNIPDSLLMGAALQ
jgi:hypothetical protein